MSDEERVQVRLADGRIGSVPKSSLAQVQADGGRIAGSYEADAAKKEAESHTIPGMVREHLEGEAATGAGLLRGATMGASDETALNFADAVGLREPLRQKLDQLRENHAWKSGAGELVGAVLPGFVTGGAATAERAAPLAERLAPEAAQFAEKFPTIGEALEGVASKVAAEAEPLVAKAAQAGETTLPEALAKTPTIGEALGGAAQVANDVAPAALDAARAAEPAAASLAQVAPELAQGAATAAESAATRTPSIAEGIAQGLPANMLGQVGDAVERGVSKLMGPEAESLVGKVLQSAVKQGARGAVEGALYGASDQLTEDRLGNHETNAEKMISAMGHGALWGGATGAALGGGGVLTRKVAGSVAGAVRGMAGEQAWRALSPKNTQRITRMAEDIPGGVRAVGDLLLEKRIIQAGDTVGSEQVLARIQKAKEEAGQLLGALRDAHDAAGIKGPVLGRLIDDFDSKVMGRLEALPSMNAGSISRVDALKEDLAKYAVDGRLTFGKATELRQRLDDSIKWTSPAPGAPANELNDALKGMRRSLESEVERAIDEGGSNLGADYRKLKGDYRKLSIAEAASEDGVSRRLQNRKASPTDYLTFAGGLATGHAGLALVGGAAHHIVRERGNATAAVMLDKISSYGVVRAARDKADRQISRGVGRFFGEERTKVLAHPSFLEGSHEERVERLAKSITSGAFLDKTAEAIDPIAAHLPKTSGAFVKSSQRVMSYLATLLPKSTPGSTATPHLDTVEWSDSDKARFGRAVDIAHDPMTVLPELESGTITPDQAQGLRTMYPGLYTQMCDELANKLAAQKDPLSYEQRLSLSVFLGQPCDPSLEQTFIGTMQANFPTEHGIAVGAQPKKTKGAPGPEAFQFIGATALDDTSGLDED